MKQINISGIIGWDSTAQQLREALAAAAGDSVEILISSPGGFVSDGLEMFNLIRNYSGHTTARLSGYAMSMASYIPLAAKRIVAEDNAIYMIHNVRGGVYGDHNEILNYGETTKAMSKMIARAYAKRTGKSLDDVYDLMDRESYFFGADMVDHGFVDEIIVTNEENDQVSAVALAQAMHRACVERMSADQQAVKNDLTRMAAICGATANHHQPAKPATPHTGGKIMTLEKLKADHPDLVAALVAEAISGMITPEQLATARTEAATAEHDRIKSVRAQLIPGHEALIEALAFDGKTTGAEAAQAIVAAENKLRTQAAANLDADSNDVAPPADDSAATTKTMKRADFDKLDQQARRAFFSAGGKLI